MKKAAFSKKTRLTVTLSFILSAFVACFISHAATQDNPQEHYCSYVAYPSAKPGERAHTFIKQGSHYVPYDAATNDAADVYYIQLNDRDVTQANWLSQQAPCRLQIAAVLRLFAIFWILTFIVSCLPVWLVSGFILVGFSAVSKGRSRLESAS